VRSRAGAHLARARTRYALACAHTGKTLICAAALIYRFPVVAVFFLLPVIPFPASRVKLAAFVFFHVSA